MSGAALCVANLKTIFKHIEDEARGTVKEWADETMLISKENYCPVKKGVLKSTGKVTTITGTTREFAIRLSYGEGIDYAIPVHEIPRYHPNPSNAQYKYLSTPFNMRIDSLMQDLKIRCGTAL